MLTGARLIYLIIYVSNLEASRGFYEGVLGFRVLEQDAASVKYGAGHSILWLRRAADFGVRLRDGRDRSIDITFLVDDFRRTRAALESRGVRLSPTLTYEVGTTADFYDPDGHWFTLYEPSEAALGWPSGLKIKALRASSRSEAGANGSPAAADPDGGYLDGERLDGRDLVYLFLFVEDSEATSAFYNEALGLEVVESVSCRRGLTRAPAGVVKYDAGGLLLTTHLVDDGHAAVHRVTTEGSEGVALVFHVADMGAAVSRLSGGGVKFTRGPTTTEEGTMAGFEDPNGRVYHLYEPSAEALSRPGGAMIEHILTACL